MASVTYDHATRVYPGADRPAVAQLELAVEDGEFMVLVGPSGCGKTTALRMVAGLEEVDEGTIHIGEQDVTHAHPKSRDVAMVFQNYALYPHMTVADNMSFSLRMARRPKAEIDERVREAATILGLEEYLDRKPRALSGGQRQRVAMGRAIVRNPAVYLMDEPLSNLDAQLRVQTRAQIAALQRRLGVTTLYVTHDQVEAMTMGDRVAVLRDGRLQQVGTPNRLYAEPSNVFVARFIGSPSMNVREAAIVGEAADIGGYSIPLPRRLLSRLRGQDGERVLVGFRPEAVELVSNGSEGLEVVAHVVEELGADAYLYGSLLGREDVLTTEVDVVARIDPRRVPANGERVKLRVEHESLHVFSAATGERLT
jgi:multiple sugar transport system ATP-binding protein